MRRAVTASRIYASRAPRGKAERPLRCGATLAELVIVVTLLGVLLGVAVPRARAQLDRISVNAAIGDVTAVLHAARTMAIGVPAAVAVHIDTASGTLTVRHDSQFVMARGIGAAHGVRLAATRDSLAWDMRGLGRGAANLSIVVRRGAVAETVFVSRMGRVRTGG